MTQQYAETTYTLHERLFKEFLRYVLTKFMELFFPELAKQLDFSTTNFVDKELIINFPESELHSNLAYEKSTVGY